MSQKITVITFDGNETVLDQDTVISIVDSELSPSKFTNYENGTVLCPNGKKMVVKTIEINDDLYPKIKTKNYGSEGDKSLTVTELIDSVGVVVDPFDSYTLIEPQLDTQVDDLSDSFYIKMENFLGVGNSNWNPKVVIRTTNIDGKQIPPMDIEIYNEDKELLETYSFSLSWSGSVSTTITHQIAYYKIIYKSITRNSFLLKIE